MSRRYIEWEHRPGEELVLRFRPPILGLIPKEARGHVRLARKEMLLALRSIIDTGIKQMEEGEKRATAKRRTKVEVE